MHTTKTIRYIYSAGSSSAPDELTLSCVILIPHQVDSLDREPLTYTHLAPLPLMNSLTATSFSYTSFALMTLYSADSSSPPSWVCSSRRWAPWETRAPTSRACWARETPTSLATSPRASRASRADRRPLLLPPPHRRPWGAWPAQRRDAPLR